MSDNILSSPLPVDRNGEPICKGYFCFSTGWGWGKIERVGEDVSIIVSGNERTRIENKQIEMDYSCDEGLEPITNNHLF